MVACNSGSGSSYAPPKEELNRPPNSEGRSEAIREATRPRNEAELDSSLNKMLNDTEAIQDALVTLDDSSIRSHLESIKSEINAIGIQTIAGTPDGALLPKAAVFLEKALVKKDRAGISQHSNLIELHITNIILKKKQNQKIELINFLCRLKSILNPEILPKLDEAMKEQSEVLAQWDRVKDSALKKVDHIKEINRSIDELKGAKTVSDIQAGCASLIQYEPEFRASLGAL